MIIMKKIINLYKKYKEVINYLIFGFLTTVLVLIVYYILTFTIIDPDDPIMLQVANVISWLIGVLFAYVTNRKYVFESKNENKIEEASKFIFARLVTLIMDMFIMLIGVTLLKGNDKIVKIISQIVVIISNYLFSKILVFKKEIK